MGRKYVYVAAMIAVVAVGSRAHSQQAVVLKATGVSNCASGLPTPGVAGSPIALATDLYGHLCLLGGGSGGSVSSSSFTVGFPSSGVAIGVKDHTGTSLTHLKVDASNNLVATLAGSLPGFASPPAIAQSGAWNVGLTGPLPAFATVPAFKIDQSTPGSSNLVEVGGALPGFASPPAVAQSGAWSVGVTGTLPAFAAVPAFKIDQSTPGMSNLVEVGGALPAFASPPAVAQSGAWSVGVSGTLPAFATVPAFKIDQSTPGMSNLVEVGGTLPGFASPPAVAQSGAWSVGLTGTLPAFGSPPPVSQSGTWTMQPGNAANTTPWLMTVAQGGNSATVSAGGALRVDGSAATQPVSKSGTWGVGVEGVPYGSGIGSLGVPIGGMNANGLLTPPRTFSIGTGGTSESMFGTNIRITNPAGTTSVEAGTYVSPLFTSSGSVSAGANVPTTSAVTYSANQSIGGLQTISVFRSTSVRSGTLSKIRVGFKGANQTPSLKVYVWEANPNSGGTTCTNNAAFAAGAADWDKLVDIYTIVPTTSTTTAMTNGSIDLATPVVNRDGAATTNLYACVVTESSVTLASTSDMVFHMRVAQD